MAFASLARGAALVVAAAVFAPFICESSLAHTPPSPAVAAPVEGPSQLGPELTIDRDLVYSSETGRALGLDLYRPTPASASASASTKSPVVIWIHGDGTLGGKAASPAVALIRPGGLAVASIEYRSGTGVTLAMQLEDVKAAVRWLRAHADQYKLDPSHIGVMGFGLGGQLAALAGTTGDLAPLDGRPDPRVSSRVQAVVDLAGPVTNGGLNPAAHVTADDSPFLILHGTADRSVSTRESQALISALKVGKVESTLILPMAVSHDLGDLLAPTAVQSIARFFDQYLLDQRIPGSLSPFIATPPGNYIDPVAVNLSGTLYGLYPTPARGAETFAPAGVRRLRSLLISCVHRINHRSGTAIRRRTSRDRAPPTWPRAARTAPSLWFPPTRTARNGGGTAPS